jgi:hypothetical protein
LLPYAKNQKEGTVTVGLIGNQLIYKQIIIKNLHLELLVTFSWLPQGPATKLRKQQIARPALAATTC